MDEAQIIELSLSAKNDLSNISAGVQQINEQVNLLVSERHAEIVQKLDNALAIEGESEAEDNQDIAETVEVTVEPTQFETDLLQFEYMQTVTGILIAVTLMLSLGVQLFLAFNKHWR